MHWTLVCGLILSSTFEFMSGNPTFFSAVSPHWAHADRRSMITFFAALPSMNPNSEFVLCQLNVLPAPFYVLQ